MRKVSKIPAFVKSSLANKQWHERRALLKIGIILDLSFLG